MANQDIAKILRTIGEYLAMQDAPFKPRAYEKAAETVEALEEDVDAIYGKGGLKALEALPGIGKSIAEHIEELLTTGKLKYYEKLRKKAPVDLEKLTAVEGLGPKKIKVLYEKLGVRNLDDLEKAAQKKKIRKLEGFGETSEEKILRGIEFVKKSGGRFILGFVMPDIRKLEQRLGALKDVKRVIVAGSVRRRKETIGDVDILAISDKPARVMDFFVHMPEVVAVTAHGETKSAVKLKSGMDVDLRVVPAKSYGAALNYFTGSKNHNVALREIAIKHGWKLNEYGLSKGAKMIAGRTEEEIYGKLGLRYIEPEMREMTGEIEAARANKLPKLIGYGDLKGDLQTQTNWTDGSASIEEMAKAAMDAGLEYIAITDHTKRLAMTHGLDARRITQQMKEIDAANSKAPYRAEPSGYRQRAKSNFRILKGSECDILKDGSLDLPDEILKQLDVVGASVHSFFNLPREEQTKRIVKAMRNPHVDIFFHPTGRLIQHREPYEADMDEIIRVAKETGTILEIDAYPDRLDLKDEYIRKAVALGVKLAIDSDAHAPQHFSFLEHGIAQARRGWTEKKDIINAWPVEKMLNFLKEGR